MWKFLRKRRALQAYRTTLFKQLRRTYGRKLYYSPAEVTSAAGQLRGIHEAFVCYALGMYCERAVFDAYHAAKGETCDYDAVRAEAFGSVPEVTPNTNLYVFGADASYAAEGVHHDAGGDCGGGDYSGGGDFGGGGDCGGGGGGD